MKLKTALLTNLCLMLVTAMVALTCFFRLEVSPALSEDDVFRHGDPSSSKVSLMFNVYQGTNEVYRILGTLSSFSVKATFFVGGSWADDNNACVNAILEGGHELGSHGYFHKDQDKLTEEENYAEMKHCHDLIALMTGYEIKLFAPPSGAYSSATIAAARRMGYQVILWSRDTIDWRDRNASVILERAKKATGGDFVLMHPMAETADMLGELLTYYRSVGLVPVTVSENLGYGGE